MVHFFFFAYCRNVYLHLADTGPKARLSSRRGCLETHGRAHQAAPPPPPANNEDHQRQLSTPTPTSTPPNQCLKQECLIYTHSDESEEAYCADTCAPGRCDPEGCVLAEVPCDREPCPPVAECTNGCLDCEEGEVRQI